MNIIRSINDALLLLASRCLVCKWKKLAFFMKDTDTCKTCDKKRSCDGGLLDCRRPFVPPETSLVRKKPTIAVVPPREAFDSSPGFAKESTV